MLFRLIRKQNNLVCSMDEFERVALERILKLAESAESDAHQLAIDDGLQGDKAFVNGVLKERLKTVATEAREALLHNKL